jgi:hypothetical protein
MLHFLGIGAQKAGTTWLYQQLARHPQVRFPAGKEVHYWDLLEAGRRDEPEHWYQQRFPASPAADIRQGEITPAYAVLDSQTVARIAALYPELRILFILRNPIERAWSAAQMALRGACLSNGEASDAWFLEIVRGRGSRLRGDYPRTLGLWRQHFGREAVQVLSYDELSAAPRGLLHRVARHLDLDPAPFAERPESELRARIQPRFSRSPPIRPSLIQPLCEQYREIMLQLSREPDIDARCWLDFCNFRGD